MGVQLSRRFSRKKICEVRISMVQLSKVQLSLVLASPVLSSRARSLTMMVSLAQPSLEELSMKCSLLA